MKQTSKDLSAVAPGVFQRIAVFATAFLSLLLTTTTLSYPADNPPWCLPGYRCVKADENIIFTLKEARALAIQQEEYRRLRVLRSRRFHLGFACGAGIFAQTEHGEVSVDSAPGCLVGIVF